MSARRKTIAALMNQLGYSKAEAVDMWPQLKISKKDIRTVNSISFDDINEMMDQLKGRKKP